VNKGATTQTSFSSDHDGIRAVGPPIPVTKRVALPVVAGLRPKQVLAAMMLVEGRMAKDVAQYLHVSPETVSRWRSHAAFQLLMGDLLQESIDATRLGLVSLCSESILHLRGLIWALDDKTALKAISLLFSKAGPVLAAVSSEVQRPPPRNPRPRRSQLRRPLQSIGRNV
jgi:hypothetical protein